MILSTVQQIKYVIILYWQFRNYLIDLETRCAYIYNIQKKMVSEHDKLQSINIA
jgi:hypothetical protein